MAGALRHLDRGSLQRQWTSSVAGVVAVLFGVSLVSALAVIGASMVIGDTVDRVTPLRIANKDVLVDMTMAESALRGYAISGDRDTLAPFFTTMGFRPVDLQQLRAQVGDDPGLLRSVRVQERATGAWLGRYALPRIELGEEPNTADSRLFGRGERLFRDVTYANNDVDKAIDRHAAELEARADRVLWSTLGLVALLPALAALGFVGLSRRLNRRLVTPLTEISRVLGRLRDGEVGARAPVSGPREIREIAAALNGLTEENERASEVEADVLTQLQSYDRVRADLVSTVSHELRTPLTSITGYLELLHEDLLEQLTEDQGEMFEIVRRNLGRLNELITDLLALSRAEETLLVVEPVDLRAVAAEVAADVRLTAAGRDVAVRVLPPPSPVPVLGDRSQLVRAVQNLVTNAVKFSRPGGTVLVRSMVEQDRAVVEVADEGIGIPQADLAGLGSRFFRGSNAVAAEIAGTGLGLRIVQTILGRHEGDLAVESVEGEGSTFTLSLPLAVPASPQVETPRPAGKDPRAAVEAAVEAALGTNSLPLTVA